MTRYEELSKKIDLCMVASMKAGCLTMQIMWAKKAKELHDMRYGLLTEEAGRIVK
jgi:hypothetical protein